MEKMTDEEWLAVLSGEVTSQNAPVLPPEDVQVTTNGRSGRRIMEDAFMFYSFLEELLAKHHVPLSRHTQVLDFGCGWGRILRIFLRDVDPENLLGVDAQDWMLDLARETTGRSFFQKVEEAPPSNLPSARFDLIYAYSVFSHLSETTANGWAKEFERLLAPGGLAVLTTRPRSHIDVWRSAKHENTKHTGEYKSIFNDPDGDLAKYDRGEFVFHPYAAHDLSAEHYGEAVIPEA